MQALGLIETKGLLAAVECLDTMLKAAHVSFLEKSYVGGGLVTVCVTGDVGAVKAAVEAGSASVKKLSESLLISEHVIPRPHKDLEIMMTNVKHDDLKHEKQDETKYDLNEKQDATKNDLEEVISNEIQNDLVSDVLQKDFTTDYSKIIEFNKAYLDDLFNNYNIETVLEVLRDLKVSNLRRIARQYEKLSIDKKAISKADKNKLVEEFELYYSNLNS